MEKLGLDIGNLKVSGFQDDGHHAARRKEMQPNFTALRGSSHAIVHPRVTAEEFVESIEICL